MRSLLLFFIAGMMLTGCADNNNSNDYVIKPVPFTAVALQDNFWALRIKTNHDVTIPFALDMCERTGRIDNFRKAAGLMDGPYTGRRFNDSDVYKILEGAAYSLSNASDSALKKRMEDIISLIGQAQEDDGYLYAARTVDPAHPAPGAGSERWIHLQGSHELYNVGHLYETAAAHYLLTGKKSFLDIALKNAELIDRVFGPEKRHDRPGHQEIEIGLCKLYRITGNRKYLDLAKFFLDQRGRKHDSEPYPDSTVYAIYNGRKYQQDHLPVLEQTEAVGHAVRAVYMYAGMADVAALSGNNDYVTAIDRIWENVVTKKMYITGGIGARHTSEAFGDAYELPNKTAYTETCAAIGNAFWNHRMFLLHGESKYIDVLERVMYNGVLSGVSLEGNRFFYQNPLESNGEHERSEWFEVSCCPGNAARFLPSVSGYMYAVSSNTVYANLFAGSTAKITLPAGTVTIRQETTYPWSGKVSFKLNMEHPQEFDFCIRIPGWSVNKPVYGDLYSYRTSLPETPQVTINGSGQEYKTEKGYAVLSRMWNPGDEITLLLEMPVREALSNKNLIENAGKAALERGPLVYCLEWPDNEQNIFEICLDDQSGFDTEFKKDLLGGIRIISGTAALKNGVRSAFTAIPYYAWAHRGKGDMAVWIKTNVDR